jgi:hypothetical protein
MTPAAPESDFLSRIPAGGLLAAVSRLLLSADRREEFLGDLVEEGSLRLRVGSPRDVAIWMWSQLLRSAPSLVGCRLRRLATRAQPLPGGGLLVASRSGHRGWPLSLAVSVSAHALVLVAAVSWVFYRVEEIDPERFVIELPPAELADPGPAQPPKDVPVGFADLPAPTRAARPWRPARRPLPASVPLPAAPGDPAALPPGAAPEAPAVQRTAVLTSGLPGFFAPTSSRPSQPGMGSKGPEPRRLPPRVGEKRCLSCPTPQLPYPYGRLGVGQEMLVKTCVSVRGQVSSVQVIRGIDRTIDAKVVETVRGWRLLPYSLDGHAVPFCYTTRFLFTTH